MGSMSALVVGSNIEEQLMPYVTSDDDFLNRNPALYCYYWRVCPPRNVMVDDWRYAFRLKPGHSGDARFVRNDDPDGLSYSALKEAIDFEYMLAEVTQGAGEIWDYSREIGIPDVLHEYALRDVLPGHDPSYERFDDLLSDRINIAYPDSDDLQFAWAKFVDMKRIIYPRDRYIDLMYKSRMSAGCLIEKGVVTSFEDIDMIFKIQSEILRWDAWLDYVHDFIQKLPGEVTLSQVYLKQ